MLASFVHLRTHTEYSLVDGLVRIKPWMQAVAADGMPAAALTDVCNLFAAVKFYKAAWAKGIKPLLGAELWCCSPEKPEEAAPIVVLCQNEQGYRHLMQLISQAYQEGQVQGRPYVHWSWLVSRAEGLIVLSGAQEGIIGQALLADDEDKATQWAHFLAQYFPQRFYLEIQRVGRSEENIHNARLVALANALSLPLVATNDVRFLRPEDWEAHEIRVCIHSGTTIEDTTRPKRYTRQQYFRSTAEMQALFHDIPEALQNTCLISQRCTVALTLDKVYLPDFPVPAGISLHDYLAERAEEGLRYRLEQRLLRTSMALSDEQSIIYAARLDREIKVINAMGFAGYFLIVADFIQWGKQNGVAVGPGRGSGAGSLVAYVLGITDLDPLDYDLLFERFLNPERVSMPDFDIDFCMEGRDRVIEYVAKKYGRACVSQIITFGTMAAKAVIRDVGRVLAYPYSFVDKIAKLIPFEIGITLEKALEDVPELRTRYAEEEEVKVLLDMGRRLEGISRNAGKHAGGVVIAPSCITDFSPIYCESDSVQQVTQFDKDDVESIGLVKFDFLGLRTLTIIQWALEIINAERATESLPPLDINLISLEDSPTFELLKKCQTTAIFQLESRGMKELVHRLQPDHFEEIVALVALFRPGPLQSGMVDDFIDRKHGRSTVEYLHPDLTNILKPTYGVILYQEQVMQIAQVLAGYTLGAADMLRRAMGKKKPEEMAKQRTIFTEGAVNRGVEEEVARHIFDLMEKFAGYGFNKSHSAAYALIAYQTAWLKTHYPAAFMASVLSADMDNTDKLTGLVAECKRMGLQVLAPNINRAHYRFTVFDPHTILFGLGAIKGVGESSAALVDIREKMGAYQDLQDLCQKIDLRKMNKRVLEALIKSGAMDCFGNSRAQCWVSLDSAMKSAERFQKNIQSGQGDLFATIDTTESHTNTLNAVWSPKEQLQYEKEALGFYMSGHPADQYAAEWPGKIMQISSLHPQKSKKAWICVQLKALRMMTSKRGKPFYLLQLEDGSANIEVLIFDELYAKNATHLLAGTMLVIQVEVSIDTYNGRIKLAGLQILSIEEARGQFIQTLRLTLKADQSSLLPDIKKLCHQEPGDCPIQIAYENTSARVVLKLPDSFKVSLSDSILTQLRILLGEEQIEMIS
ncbi:MAG: DNA polymerase III subunit alpha [Legionellaceae bacterium]|nr:DNA polymerase III subunit alpha [Legionellaceae bacterium]